MRPFDELPEATRKQIDEFRARLEATPSRKTHRVPRRIDRERWTNAERAIQLAIDVVETMGCDERLTRAVVLLGDAKGAVSDYVDAQIPNI